MGTQEHKGESLQKKLGRQRGLGQKPSCELGKIIQQLDSTAELTPGFPHPLQICFGQ